jgi:Zn-dependent M32 family carboxypeptidase
MKMKRIVFKKLSKELIDEGITIDLLNKVQDSGKFSPAMMKKGDDPISLVRANNQAFWVQLEDGAFLEEDGKLMLFDVKSCIIARARYWTLFSDVETAMSEKRRSEAKEKEIEKEVQRLQSSVKKEAEKVIKKFRKIEEYAGVRELDSLTEIIRSLNPQAFELKSNAAKKFLEENQGQKDLIDSIEKSLKEEDYDRLYILLKQDGLPLIASISANNSDLVKRFFHREKIEKTIDTITSQSHIRNVAMFIVNERYS